MKRKKFLLLDGQSGKYWLKTLDSAITSLGGELIVRNIMLKERLDWGEYDYVILDAGTVAIIPEAIKEIREKNQSIKAIVVSAAPRWDQAREAILAGAVDYVRKESDIRYLTEALSKVLKLT